MITDYLIRALDPTFRQQIIHVITRELKKIEGDYAIAFTGMSGSLIAPAVADELGKPMVMVRKKYTRHHSCYKVEGSRTDKYVIIDDMVDTGETINHIRQYIKKYFNKEATLAGLVLYNQKAACRIVNLKKYNCPLLVLNSFMEGILYDS